MERDFWLRAWAEGRTGFHSDALHPTLLAHAARFLGDGPHRVLVPLCGKSVDLLWLRDHGHEVIGVEFAPAAVHAFCAAHGLSPAREDTPHGFTLRTPGLTLLCADFFAIDPLEVGPVDRVWDRAALVAIDPARRAEYGAQIERLLAPDGRVLLEAFEYDQAVMSGPPWSVPRAAIGGIFPSLGATALSCEDTSERVKFPGHREFLVHAWELSRRAD